MAAIRSTIITATAALPGSLDKVYCSKMSKKQFLFQKKLKKLTK